MLFIITQTHKPNDCPVDSGGSEELFEKAENIDGLTIVAAYGAYPEHKLYFIVETDDYANIDKLLAPGKKKCRVRITPVDQFI